jgi:hypothetical protein
MSYTYAWLVVAGAGLLGSLGWFVLTRNIANTRLRAVLRLLPPVLMLVPAPVPGYEGQLAPAFIVFLFESLFQAEGEPLIAAAILLAAAVAAIGMGWLLGRPAAAPADT